MKAYCGWCIDGIYDKCIGAIRSPQGGLWFCDHPDRQPTTRCVDCGNKTPGEIYPEIWECLGDHRRKHREKFKTPPTRPAFHPKPKMVTTPKRSQSCSCDCGGTTKGGKFLPGHDSKYLSRVQDSISEGTTTLEGALGLMQSSGLSEALQNKLRKRVGK